MIRKLIGVTLAVSLCLAGTVRAEWLCWEGSVSADWSNAANWVLANGNPAGRTPTFSDQVGIGSLKDPLGYWPAIYNHPDELGYSAYSELLSMSEWAGSYSELTFSGGIHWQGNAYFWVGRHEGDTAVVNLNSGGISHTRWLLVGGDDDVPGAAVGRGIFNMRGGAVYSDSLSVGMADGSGDGGSNLNISGGQIFVGGDDYPDASFLVGPTATMDIKPGGYVSLDASSLQFNYAAGTAPAAAAKGALNIIADGTGSGKLVIPALVTSPAELLAYFGYDDGSGTIMPGHVNAIFNGGAGQFTFFQPGGIYTEITVIPEPATLALVGIGGLAMIRRKR